MIAVGAADVNENEREMTSENFYRGTGCIFSVFSVQPPDSTMQRTGPRADPQ